jgi:hypothetical protein
MGRKDARCKNESAATAVTYTEVTVVLSIVVLEAQCVSMVVSKGDRSWIAAPGSII